MLADTEIADDGLANLIGLKNLRVLDLKGSDTTNDGVKHLAAMTWLTELRLNYGRFTDKALPQLAAVKSLERLS